jgi:hypothetical protein
VEIDIHMLNFLQRDGQPVINHHVREGVDRLGRRTGVELPCNGELGCCVLGRVCPVFEGYDLSIVVNKAT